MFGGKLKIWRKRDSVIELDDTPSGEEEERFLFSSPVDDPRDLNAVIIAERYQNLEERILFTDRAFIIVIIWVIFLVTLPVAQMIFSIWGHGLSDVQFTSVITSTTVSVFGFWYLVGRYLFPNGSNN